MTTFNPEVSADSTATEQRIAITVLAHDVNAISNLLSRLAVLIVSDSTQTLMAAVDQISEQMSPAVKYLMRPLT